MGRNIEIKARARNFERQTELAKALATETPTHLAQEDTFFNVPRGRLKLRKLGDGSAELIQYDREDSAEPKESRYNFLRTRDPRTSRKSWPGLWAFGLFFARSEPYTSLARHESIWIRWKAWVHSSSSRSFLIRTRIFNMELPWRRT